MHIPNVNRRVQILEAAAFDDTLKALAKGLKGWADVIASDFKRWDA